MHTKKSLPLNETDQVFYCYLIHCYRNLTSILNIKRAIHSCGLDLEQLEIFVF